VNVINLVKQKGSFETSAADQPVGFRTFGLWSFANVTPGTLVVIQRANAKALYEVQSAATTFTGSNTERFWEGTMKDVIAHRAVTQEMKDALEQAGLA
jgi:hypothetical protein